MASKAKRTGQSLGGTAGRHFLALEPRMMFDGAAVATAAAGAEGLVPTSAAAPAPDAGWAAADQPSEERPTQDETRDTALADTAPPPRAIVFVDGAVKNYQDLIAGIDGDYEIVVLDRDSDGVEQIANILAARRGVSAIHIISHGDDSNVRLGTAVLNRATIAGEYADELAIWGAALTESGDLLIYGCDFGDDGAALALLADATGADVAASTDDTGSAQRGGDWDLEARAGTIEAATLAAPEWDGLLAAPTLDTAPALTYTAAEDAPAPANGSAVGVPVSTYTGGISDTDANAQKGIAITANGQQVKAGTPIARLVSPDIDRDIARTRVQIAELEARSGRATADAEDRANFRVLRSDLAGQRLNLAGLVARREKLTLVAPADGMITDISEQMTAGRWLSGDEPIARLVSPRRYDVQAYVDEADLWRLEPGATARFVPDDAASASRPARLDEIASAAAEQMEFPALASTNGGPIPVNQRDDGALKPLKAIYRLHLTTPTDADAANRLAQRRTGVVVIHARPSSPLLQWFRAIGRIWRAERPV
ncbi:DUF4347 domain-containing protein [Sphingomonas sp.]|uniref:DUF4347 domain-containing protein n=1 Tax=Sphingomonas sp. TaxID=28214 RepID=UPI00257F48F0|nr:DUF4347 domain-containing protein [Sphingomonas sp.]